MSDMKYSYKDMPRCNESIAGMKVVQGDTKNIRAYVKENDVIYMNKDNIDLRIRFIYPETLDEEKTYPLFFHIQGSAWLKQNLSNHLMDFKEIVKEGYIVAIIEYRPSTVALFPSQVEDAKMAMRYIMEHYEELRIDINNIFVSGDSSGGHTALLCYATWNNNLLDTCETKLCNVCGFIDLYGVVDLVSMSDKISAVEHNEVDSPEALLIGGLIPRDNVEIADKASVLRYINKDSNNTPLLVMHGDKDRTVPFSQSMELYEKLREFDKDVTFYKVKDADHGGSTFYCESVYEIIVDFLKDHTIKY